MGSTALPYLLRALADGKVDIHTLTKGHLYPWEIQDRATAALKALGSNAAPLAPSLVRLLKSADPRVRSHTAEILGLTGLANHMTVAALLGALGDDKAAYAAALSLGQLGRAHTNVVQHLMIVAAGSDPIAALWADDR
jgi:HEAT repeat protein